MNSTGTTNWEPEPERRGTLGLLYTCLSTILLCTWSAMHPNLPARKDSSWIVFRRRIIYLLFMIVAPEMVSFQAMEQLAEALHVKNHSFFMVMGGYVIEEDGRCFSITSQHLLPLLDNGTIVWPDTEVSDINDRSKADWLVKLLALLQAAFFLTQIVGRAAQYLPISTLELFTLGILMCSFFTYRAWWHKPLDIKKPVKLQTRSRIPATVLRYTRLPLRDVGVYSLWSKYAGTLVCFVFGAIHMVGWEFYFPSTTERWFWRVSSIVCMVSSLVIAVDLSRKTLKMREAIYPRSLFVMGLPYVLCRTYMFAEMFIWLRAAPVEIYQTPRWSQYLPSFG